MTDNKEAHRRQAKIVLAEGDDIRVIEAASRASADDVASCILIGNETLIRASAREAGFSIDGVQIEEPSKCLAAEQYAQDLFALRAKKGMTLEQAKQQVLDPLCYADLMVHAGDADGSIAGARYTTGDRVRSALQIIGVAAGFKTVSSFFLMIFESEHHAPKRRMLFSDCALVVNPSAEQLSEIALASANSAARLLRTTPRLAMLSFSTDGSANHEMVDKVRNATELLRSQNPALAVDGEIQLDAAIVPSVAALKMPNSSIRGDANVLIFPDLNAGNIGYKIAQRLGGAKAIGPILQGLNKPANDLSRGCSADDVYELIGLTVQQVE